IRPARARLAPSADRGETRERRRRGRGRGSRGPGSVRRLSRGSVHAGDDRDLSAAARGVVPGPRRARAGDPHHGAPRARPLLRDGRAGTRRIRVRLMLETLEILAGIVFAVVLVAFFFGPWRD